MTLERRDPEALDWFRKLEAHCRLQPNGSAALNVGFRQKEGTVVHHEGVSYPIREIHVTIVAASTDTTLRHTPYWLSSSEGGNRLIHELSTDIGDTRFRMVMPDGMKSQRIMLDIGPKNPRERAELRKRQRKANRKKP